MKMNRKLTWMLLLGAMAMSFTQCKDSGSEVKPDDENELITSVTLKFTEQGTTNVTSFSYKDADGDGGNAADKI
jgi:transposase